MGVRPWTTFTNQQQWKEYLQDLVKRNDKALIRAIEVIYDRQTEHEKYYGVTVEENGQGFGKVDAEFFTSIVTQLRSGKGLTKKQLAVARNKMPKYWRQLMIVSKEKMAKEERDAESRREDSTSDPN